MTDKKIVDFYKKGYDYMSRAPYFIDKEKLTEKQADLLMGSKKFCMLPWMHLHAPSFCISVPPPRLSGMR